MFGGLSEDFVVKIRSQVNPGFHLSSVNNQDQETKEILNLTQPPK